MNARKQLSAFIRGAKRELLIYDSKISDRTMIRLLEERAKAGVEVRIVGRLTAKSAALNARRLTRMRLHTRTIIRDGRQMFIGSQSLRELELDARREVGVIVRDSEVVNSLVNIFNEDWQSNGAPSAKSNGQKAVPLAKAVTKAAESVIKSIPPIAPVVEQAVQQIVGDAVDIDLDHREVETTVKKAVKEAVTGVVRDVVGEASELKEAGKGK